MTANCICKPIGFVESGISETSHGPSPRFETISRIRILDEYAQGLKGLDDFSHVIIVWWMHKIQGVTLTVIPEAKKDDSRIGIFATRLPTRVNPLGLSVVELIGVEGSCVNIRGFDGWEGTPVLDIKPYDYYDMVKSPKVPEWFTNFWQKHKQQGHYSQTAPWLGP